MAEFGAEGHITQHTHTHTYTKHGSCGRLLETPLLKNPSPHDRGFQQATTGRIWEQRSANKSLKKKKIHNEEKPYSCLSKCLLENESTFMFRQK